MKNYHHYGLTSNSTGVLCQFYCLVSSLYHSKLVYYDNLCQGHCPRSWLSNTHRLIKFIVMCLYSDIFTWFMLLTLCFFAFQVFLMFKLWDGHFLLNLMPRSLAPSPQGSVCWSTFQNLVLWCLGLCHKLAFLPWTLVALSSLTEGALVQSLGITRASL